MVKNPRQPGMAEEVFVGANPTADIIIKANFGSTRISYIEEVEEEL